MDETAASLNTGPWRFRDGKTITLVCAQLPRDLSAADEYTDLNSPDYIQLYTFSELDALFELYGHLRAANPANQVDLRVADRLTPDEFTSHLVSLGGIDWNAATSTLLQDLQLPVARSPTGARAVRPMTSTSNRTMARSSAPSWTKQTGRKYCGSMSRYSPGR